MANRDSSFGFMMIGIILVTLGLITGSLGSSEGQGSDGKDHTEEVPADGCQGYGQCCQGKNNICRGSGPRLNDQNTTICFCDSACLDIGDCCTDFPQFCQPADCILAEKWDDWGECDVRCGTGVKQRTRKIIQHPLNGGKPCGITVEKVVCEGTNCKIARAPDGFEELRETGKIIPAAFGSWRKNKKYNPYQDIRKNLFEHYDNSSGATRPSYCMKFELTEVRSLCKKAESFSNILEKGTTVCVECQPMAMKKKLGSRCKGHGVYLKETRWNAVTVPGCHGKWTMQTRPEDCQCDPENKLSFVLV